MPIEGSYAIWNNHGGTGKTTFTYHLAIKYAVRHPDKTIILIDMCPQADLSHAFLGDDENGNDYVSQIGTLKKDAMNFGDHKIPKTISGYLDLCTSIGLPQNIDPRTFLINVSKFNSQLPRNLYLLCGDPSIELVARALEIKRYSTATQYGTYAWKHITTCLKQFIKKIGERKGIKLCAFIDTNSAFSICTEIALCAAERLIIPINDDQLHRNAFEYMFALVYGFSHPNNVYYYYRHLSLYYRANEYDVQLPQIHLILNTSSMSSSSCTENRKSASLNGNEQCNGAAAAAGSGGADETIQNVKTTNATWDFIFNLYKNHSQAFFTRVQASTLGEFKNQFVIDIDTTEQQTTNVMRQAVRSHSPLLSVKNPNHHHNRSLNSSLNSNRNTNGLATPSPSQATPSPSPSPSQTPTPSSQVYPYQHQLHLSNPTRFTSNSNLNNSITVPGAQQVTTTTKLNNNNNNDDNSGRSNTIIFDKILDKIVERLNEK